MFKQFTKKLFNIRSGEMPKTSYAWFIRLLLKTGVVIGWTAVVAMFVTRYSIANLPFLFLIQATFTILGMLCFSFLLERIHVKSLLTLSSFLAAVTFFAAALFHENDLLFFALSILAYGMFLPQVVIFLSNYIEDFFSPWEGERLFPIIESAETVGGIAGGLVLANIGSDFMAYKLLYLWVALIFIFLLAVHTLCPKGYPLDAGPRSTRQRKSRLNLHGLHRSMQEIKRLPFLQILLIVFFIQWIIVHLLEFQFTKIIDDAIGSGGSIHEHEASLTHNLGSFHIILHGSALMVELLLGSRILKFLGTFGGFLLHSLVTLLSVISLFLGFNYFTAILVRNNFEITTIIHRNSYEISYYGFRNGTQRSVREFFEGFIFPLATIFATLMLLVIQAFFLEEHFVPAVQLFLFLSALGMTFFSFHLQKSYTTMVRKLLLFSRHKGAMLHAIEILAQNGHKNNQNILLEALRKCSDNDVKKKIAQALTLLRTS